MNRRSVTILIVIVVIVIGILGALALFQHSKAMSSTCQGKTGTVHRITIKSGVASSYYTVGHLCDKLEFTNLDNITREIAFGPHEHHVPYDGIAEYFLNKGQSFSVTLNKTGTYHWHDHLHDWIKGRFSVSR